MNITPNLLEKPLEEHLCRVDLENLKILIVATPKTGNTWLKLLLSHVYDLPVVNEELPRDIVELKRRISTLGNQWIAHQHYPSPQFELVDYLAKENVVLLTTIRHPGDVLVSWFHFAKWYSPIMNDSHLHYMKNDGEVMGEHTQEYLRNNRFAGLLQISLHWMPHVIGLVRYEDMLANPLDCLIELTNAISPVSREAIIQAVVACEIKNLRVDGHINKEFFRKGLQGEWKESIPPEILQILRTQPPYPELCNQLGYSFDDTGVSTRPAFDYTTINPFYQRQEFDNGIKITQLLSRVYFSTKNALQRWSNPFEIFSEKCFYNWLNLPSEAEMRSSSDNSLKELLITNLAYFIYHIRGDLRQAFPDLFGKNRVEFCQWFNKRTPLEYEIDGVFTTPMSFSLNYYHETKGQQSETMSITPKITDISIGTEEDQFAVNGSIFTLPKKVKPPHSWVEHIPFAFFLVHTLKPRVLVELGVYVGNSYNAFCQAVSTLKTTTQCYGIDTWRGDEHANFYDDSVYNELFAYQQREYQDLSSLLRMTFDEARNRFADGTIDLLHIDGFHTYEAVKHDFENWLPKVSDHGVVIFHDTEVRDHDFGVWQLWEEVAQTYPSFNFKHGYGLGVIAVGSQVPQEFRNFLQAANQAPFYRELFARLGHYITLLEKNKTLEKSVSSPQHLFAQLFIDTGEGFEERHSIIKTVTGEESQLEFDLSKYQGIQSLRFDPLNDLTAIEIQQTLIVDENGTSQPVANYQTNSCLQRANQFWFDHRDPQILMDLQTSSKPQRVIFQLTYLAIGNDTYRRALSEMQNLILLAEAPTPAPPETQIQPSEPAVPRYFAQLFIDTGPGFSEAQSILQPITGEESQLEFDVSGYQEIQRVRFDPLNDLTMLEIGQMLVLDDQGTVHQVQVGDSQTNATYTEKVCLVFETIDPQIVINVQPIPRPLKVIFRLKYLTIGEEPYRLLWEMERENHRQLEEKIWQLEQVIQQQT